MMKYKDEKSTGIIKTFTPADFPFLKKEITMEIFVTTHQKNNIFIGRFDPLTLIVTAPRLQAFDYQFELQMEFHIYGFFWTDNEKLTKQSQRIKRLLKTEYIVDSVAEGSYKFKHFQNLSLPPMSEKLRTYNIHAAWLKNLNKPAAAKYLIDQLKKQRKKRK